VRAPRHVPHRRPLVPARTPVPPPRRINLTIGVAPLPAARHGPDITAAHGTYRHSGQQPPCTTIPHDPLTFCCGAPPGAGERGLHLRPLGWRQNRLPLALGDLLALVGPHSLQFGAAHHPPQVRRHPPQSRACPPPGILVLLPRQPAAVCGNPAAVQLGGDPVDAPTGPYPLGDHADHLGLIRVRLLAE